MTTARSGTLLNKRDRSKDDLYDRIDRQRLTSAPCDGGPISSCGASWLCAGSRGWGSASACRSQATPWTGRCCSTAACGRGEAARSWVRRAQTPVPCSTPEHRASPTLARHRRARRTRAGRSAVTCVECVRTGEHTAIQHNFNLLFSSKMYWFRRLTFLGLFLKQRPYK